MYGLSHEKSISKLQPWDCSMYKHIHLFYEVQDWNRTWGVKKVPMSNGTPLEFHKIVMCFDRCFKYLEGNYICKFKWACTIEENSCSVHSMELHICHWEATAVWVFSMKAVSLMEKCEGQLESRMTITLLTGICGLLSAVSVALTWTWLCQTINVALYQYSLVHLF